jgi:hypothetical protein
MKNTTCWRMSLSHYRKLTDACHTKARSKKSTGTIGSTSTRGSNGAYASGRRPITKSGNICIKKWNVYSCHPRRGRLPFFVFFFPGKSTFFPAFLRPSSAEGYLSVLSLRKGRRKKRTERKDSFPMKGKKRVPFSKERTEERWEIIRSQQVWVFKGFLFEGKEEQQPPVQPQ